MSWEKELEEKVSREKLSENLGGEDRIKIQHDAGRYTIRERIDILTDKSSFNEIGKLAGHAIYNENNDLIDFDFSSSIENANLSKLNLSQKINNKLSGNIVTKLRGSNIKDLIGDLKLIDFNYSDNELNYDFEELVAQSRVVEDKRIINITSPDAIDGILIGNFKSFNFLKNIYDSFISRYSNYQYLTNKDEISFNFNLKPKIAKIFSSDFSIEENTFLGGKIDEKTFELNFNSPGVSNNDIKLKNVNFLIEDEKSQLKIQEILSPFFNGSSFVLDTDFNYDSTNIDVNFISNDNTNNININPIIGSLLFQSQIAEAAKTRNGEGGFRSLGDFLLGLSFGGFCFCSLLFLMAFPDRSDFGLIGAPININIKFNKNTIKYVYQRKHQKSPNSGAAGAAMV